MQEINLCSRVHVLGHVAQALWVSGLPVQMIRLKVPRTAAMTKNQTFRVLLYLHAEDGKVREKLKAGTCFFSNLPFCFIDTCQTAQLLEGINKTTFLSARCATSRFMRHHTYVYHPSNLATF